MRFGQPAERQRDAISARQCRELAALLQALAAGERIAASGALAQQAIAPDRVARAFLRRQARQERFHATVFEQAAAWLGGDKAAVPGLTSLRRLERAGQVAVARGDFVGSVLVQQVVLEAVGHVVLDRLDAELARREAGLVGLRRLILHQEDGHQRFGESRVGAALAADPGRLAGYRAAGQSLISTAEALLDELAPSLSALNECAGAYRRDLLTALPTWMIRRAAAT